MRRARYGSRMEARVMCTLDYDWHVKVYREDPRTARKDHSCAGCGSTIHPGSAYCYVSYVVEDSAHSEHECFYCWWTRSAFWEAHGGGSMPSCLWEELRDCVDGEHSNPWRPHLAALKRRWRTSSIGRMELAREVFRNALAHQLSLTRRIRKKRDA